MNRLAIAAVLTAILTGCADPRAQHGTHKKENTMSNARFQHGFRHDPMKWAQNDSSLQAAMVRRVVIATPKPGDQKILDARIEAILSEQQPDGALSDHELHAMLGTGRGKIRELMTLGASPQHPKIRKAIDYVLSHDGRDPVIERATGEQGMIPGVAISLHAAGAVDKSTVRAAMQRRIDAADRWIHTSDLCPWCPEIQIRSLWETRHLDKRADALITQGLQNIVNAIDTNTDTYNDPWGYVHVAGVVDHPLGCAIVERLTPMILREQNEDGGWGEHSVKVFRALKRYGLLEKLQKLPPLPVKESAEQPAGAVTQESARSAGP